MREVVTIFYELRLDLAEHDTPRTGRAVAVGLLGIKVATFQAIGILVVVVPVDFIEFFFQAGDFILKIEEDARMQVVEGAV